ncbi:hypothetical protein B0I08_103371 [Glaciihabitans tibetensis]|uniref:Uncharacterized protein n=1 Tax=Glaciihabitans tibetensis TaxID=1266600 RepID=A0A2T0VG33_9MICO|nr:hypothetical protein [Glaciihabitans tibetensis]PRY69163.1 hypothetical protein B0I08_103371 [Glaciihabitans tibetensis]
MTKVTAELNPNRLATLRLRRTRRPHSFDAPRSVSEIPTTHPLMSPEANVQRIMQTGTIWFAAAIGSVAVTLGLLLASGWRPALLTGAVRVLWWAASALVAVSVGLIGWSGCPILEVDVPTANRNKSRTMQLGTMMFIVGGTTALLAVLLGPAV